MLRYPTWPSGHTYKETFEPFLFAREVKPLQIKSIRYWIKEEVEVKFTFLKSHHVIS